MSDITSHRDEKGLTLPQRQLLQELVATGSLEQSATNLEITPRRIRYWLTHDPSFQAAFDDMFGVKDIEATKKLLGMAAGQAVEVYEEAMKADMKKTVKVPCENCGKMLNVTITIADTGARLKAADALMKISGLLKDTKKIEGMVGHVHLTGAEYITLLKLQAGMQVPEAAKQSLIAKGIDLQ